MKERPILFSAPMVRALLAGTKTQTRRLVKFPRTRDSFVLEDHGSGWWPYQSDDGESSLCDDGMERPYSSPYGMPGDRLWVKETGWQRPERTPKMMREGADTWAPYYFDADGLDEQDHADFKAWGFKRRPSIFMPRECSRITLEVTGVRVERLNDISEVDAREEGCGFLLAAYEQWDGDPDLYRKLYRVLWEQINGPNSWALNPWVWVVEFKRLTARAKGE